MKGTYGLFSGLLLAALLIISGISYAKPRVITERSVIQEELRRPAIRGAIVYKTYCTLCHGEKGDGNGRAAKLADSDSLIIKPRPESYYKKIVLKGGAAVGVSSFMPMWKEELSEEQINDVLVYLKFLNNSVNRGEIVFKTNCILCHGLKGDGNGRAAKLYDPPPANLTRSDKNDDYKRMIITLGGAAMGRSQAMPVWGEQLSTQEINDVVNYLKTILVAEQVASQDG